MRSGPIQIYVVTFEGLPPVLAEEGEKEGTLDLFFCMVREIQMSIGYW